MSTASTPNFGAFVLSLNTEFPGISTLRNTTIHQSIRLNIMYLSSSLTISITIYQPHFLLPTQLSQNTPIPQWKVFISVNHGGPFYDRLIPYKDDQQIARESIKLLKNHGM
mgnify:CR=1 FL=1|jgi:hypothetical protein